MRSHARTRRAPTVSRPFRLSEFGGKIESLKPCEMHAQTIVSRETDSIRRFHQSRVVCSPLRDSLITRPM